MKQALKAICCANADYRFFNPPNGGRLTKERMQLAGIEFDSSESAPPTA